MTDSPGKRLQTERLKRGLSVEDITNAIKLRPSLIKALETDDFAKFPSTTHARSSLSLYGKFLKIDVKDGISTLAIPAKMGIENYQYLNAEGVERHDNSSYRPQRRNRSNSSPRNGEPAPRNFGVILGVIAFLFFAVYLAINLQRLNLASAAKIPEAETTTPPPTQPETPGISPKPNKLPAPGPLPDTSNAPYYTPTLDSRRLIRPTPRPRF